MRFVGIDLAWSPRNPSGGAVLSADGRLLQCTSTLGGDNEVLDLIASAIPAGTPGLVAIDAPLAVPNQTGTRPCDRQVASIFGRFQAAPYPANRRNLDGLPLWHQTDHHGFLRRFDAFASRTLLRKSPPRWSDPG